MDAWARRFPLIVLLVLLALIFSSGYTIWQLGERVWDAYQSHYRWREEEYEKLGQLSGGMSIAKFEEELGSPLFVRRSDDGTLTERSFRGRDYWVQAVHDETGSVLLFSVTACDEDFQPTFEMPAIGGVTLNRSTLDSIDSVPNVIYYHWAVATANQNFYDEYYGGNPGLYKTYFVAINDACPMKSVDAEALLGADLFLKATPTAYFDHPAIVRFRSQSVANTYAETAVLPRVPTEEIELLRSFQIGVDRLLIRAVR